MGIGAKLVYLLKKRNSNPNELAAKVGVSPQTIYSMIKRDSKKADIEVLIKISKELGVDPEFFCDFSDFEETNNELFENVEKIVARNSNNMTSEQRIRLIQLLSDIKD